MFQAAIKCRLTSSCDRDRYYIVRRNVFKANINPFDGSWPVVTIENRYCDYWFSPGDDGHQNFLIPVVSIKDGLIDVLTGHHRSLLLMRHMDQFPLGVSNVRSQTLFVELVVREIPRGELVLLPSLPIVYCKKH